MRSLVLLLCVACGSVPAASSDATDPPDAARDASPDRSLDNPRVVDSALPSDTVPRRDSASDTAPPFQPGAPGGSDPNCVAAARPEVPAPLRTYYLNADQGDDGADGTSPGTAWKTLDRANTSARPGDLFLLAGTFMGGIFPRASGTADNMIVYRAAPGAKATLVGNGANNGYYGSRSYLVIEGLEMTGFRAPFYMLGTRHLWLRNLDLHDNGTLKMFDADDVRIEDSVISRCSGGNCLLVRVGSSRNVFLRNQMAGASGSLIALTASGDDPPAMDNVFAFNDLSNPGKGNLLYVAGQTTNLVVECNRIHHAGPTSQPAVRITADDTVVRYNLVHDNPKEAISLWGPASRNRIHGNVIWRNGGPAFRLLVPNGGQVASNVIENNIVWAGGYDPDSHWTARGVQWKIVIDQYHMSTDVWPPASLNGNVFRNNIIGKDTATVGQNWFFMLRSTLVPGGSDFYTLTSAATAFPGGVVGNRDVDPQLVNPTAGDFRVARTSQAVDNGAPVAGHRVVGAAPDIGRYEQ